MTLAKYAIVQVLLDSGKYEGEFGRAMVYIARLHVYHPWPKSVFLKTSVSRLEKLPSCVNARTLEFPALWRLHSFKSFGGNFVQMNVSVASFSPRLIFLQYNASILTFKSETNFDFVWNWYCRDFVKNHDSNLACDWLKPFSGLIIFHIFS